MSKVVVAMSGGVDSSVAAALLKEQQVLAYAFDGTRYDCGSKLGYLQATVEYALTHSEVSVEFANYLTRRVC